MTTSVLVEQSLMGPGHYDPRDGSVNTPEVQTGLNIKYPVKFKDLRIIGYPRIPEDSFVNLTLPTLFRDFNAKNRNTLSWTPVEVMAGDVEFNYVFRVSGQDGFTYKITAGELAAKYNYGWLPRKSHDDARNEIFKHLATELSKSGAEVYVP